MGFTTAAIATNASIPEILIAFVIIMAIISVMAWTGNRSRW